jgi:hypothetical protein
MAGIATFFAATASKRGILQVRTVSSLARHGNFNFIRPQKSQLLISLNTAPSTNNISRCFSSKEERSGIRGWMEDRKDRKEKEQFAEQMGRLSDMEQLTLENYRGELLRGLEGFAASIKMFQTREVKASKEVAEAVTHFIEIMGKDAIADDLNRMTRIQRLQVANKSKKTVEEIGIMLSQITNMDIMQRTLRQRKKEGKPIPQDAHQMQTVIKKEAVAVMTKSQKVMIKKQQIATGKRMARRK